MSERLYQYAVILQPTPDDAKAGKRAETIVKPTDYFMARSETEARMVANRDALLEVYMDVADRLEVIVQAFGSPTQTSFVGCTITGGI